jgi:hypothetical protein
MEFVKCKRETRKGKNVKKKKRKEVRGNQHIKVVEVRSLNLNLDLL